MRNSLSTIPNKGIQTYQARNSRNFKDNKLSIKEVVKSRKYICDKAKNRKNRKTLQKTIVRISIYYTYN